MSDWFQWCYMGGYSQYVWSAYGCVFFVLMWNGLAAQWRHRHIRNRLKQWILRETKGGRHEPRT